MSKSESFLSKRREFKDPKTGRKIVQLTSGKQFNYPLYYFIPTISEDGRMVIFHHYDTDTGEVQIYKIEIESGLTTQLTHANTPNSLWRPHLQPTGFGVRDIISCYNPVSREVIYFDRREIRAVHTETLEDRLVLTVPEGRYPCSLTGVSPNGRSFVYAHFDEKWWESQQSPQPQPERHMAKGAHLDLIDLKTGESRNLLVANYWITHANFYDNERILVSHLSTDMAILIVHTNREGYFESIRAGSLLGVPCHYHATSRGVAYEVLGTNGKARAGLYNPDTHERKEYALDIGRAVHIGRDPEARLWFYEIGTAETSREIVYFPRLSSSALNPGLPLLDNKAYRTFSNNQRSHFHPNLTPDRKNILFTGGDPETQSNQLFLLDVSDLEDTVLTD